MDVASCRTERFYLRALLLLVAGAVVLIGGYWGGARVYRSWQEHRFMRQAHVAFEKGDLRWAALAAQRALAASPDSLDACRTMAEIAERQKSREALHWRQRIVELLPDSAPDAAALAETALRLRLPQLAAEVLEKIPVSKRDIAPCQSALAHLALAHEDWPRALEHLSNAARLAPNDPARQLELARWEIPAQDRVRREHGLLLAKTLVNTPLVANAAREILLDDALRRADARAAIEAAKETLAASAASFRLRLKALEALRRFQDPAYPAALARCQAEGATTPDHAAALIRWLNGQSMALVALDWSRQLPRAIYQKLAVEAALADSCVLLGDWKALDQLLQNSCWGAAKVLRLALQSKVARETGDDVASEKHWSAALVSAGANRGQLEVLGGLASRWHWFERNTAVLWQLADDPQARRSALRALFLHYREQRDTRGLYRALLRLAKLDPHDRAVQNDIAQISLLLDADWVKARDAARRGYEKEPQNPALASTYAFALYRNGDIAGALRIMQGLTPEQLDDPPIALYYGVILAASKTKLEAQRYLERSRKASLLPEEEALRSQAANQLARR